jgi:hypothetical protein
MKRGLLSLVTGLWLLAVGAGMAALWRYKSTPGPVASAPERWPAGSALERTPGAATVLMLAHPHCPCTQASVSELAKVMAKVPRGVRAYALFIRPEGMAEDWANTELFARAGAIPGVQAVIDDEAKLARLFGAQTSGQTLVYDADGALAYRGGITSARGHEGDNGGESAVIALLRGQTTHTDQQPVFGCALEDPHHGEQRQ